MLRLSDEPGNRKKRFGEEQPRLETDFESCRQSDKTKVFGFLGPLPNYHFLEKIRSAREQVCMCVRV